MFVLEERFEWRSMLVARYQLWSAVDSAAASQAGSLWERAFVLRMVYSCPQAEATAPLSATELMLKRLRFQAPERTSDWQPAVQILQQQLQPTPTLPMSQAIANLPPYGHDACDKKQRHATTEWNEFPPVQPAMPITQI